MNVVAGWTEAPLYPFEAHVRFLAKSKSRSPGLQLAEWILAHSSRDVTHLKLQKLCFYCYGVGRALGAKDLGKVEFEAWQHGPVCKDVWFEYRETGRRPIPTPTRA